MAPTTMDILATALAQASAVAKRHQSSASCKADKGSDSGSTCPAWYCLGRSGFNVSVRNMPSAMHREGGKWSIDQFQLDKLLYEGRASCLFLATDKQSGASIALKCYHKHKLSKMNRRQVEREVDIHLNLKHKHIIKLYACFESSQSVYLVLEPAACDLFQRLKKAGPFSDQQCRDTITPLLSACMYLHGKGIVHRDIKPENVLMTSTSELKLADLGLAINMHTERPVTRLGTLEYMAPEVIRCPQQREAGQSKNRAGLAYSSEVDVYGLGVLVYELLTGSTPFSRKSRSETCEMILTAELKFPDHVSEQAASFISAALQKDAKARPSVQQLLSHPWLTQVKASIASDTTASDVASASDAAAALPDPNAATPRSFQGSPFKDPALNRSLLRAWEVDSATAGTSPTALTSQAKQDSSSVSLPNAPCSAVDCRVNAGAHEEPAATDEPKQDLVPEDNGDEAAGGCVQVPAGEAASEKRLAEVGRGDTEHWKPEGSCEPDHVADANRQDCQAPECSPAEGSGGARDAATVRVQSVALESCASNSSLFGRHRSLWAAARMNTKEQALRSSHNLDLLSTSNSRDKLEEGISGKQDAPPHQHPALLIKPPEEALRMLRSVPLSPRASEQACGEAGSGRPLIGVLSDSPQQLSKAAFGTRAGWIQLKPCPSPHVVFSPKNPPASRELYPEGLLGKQPSFLPDPLQPGFAIRVSPSNSSTSCGTANDGGSLRPSPTSDPRPGLQALLQLRLMKSAQSEQVQEPSAPQAWQTSEHGNTPPGIDFSEAPPPPLDRDPTTVQDIPWHSSPLPTLPLPVERPLLQPLGWSKTPVIRTPNYRRNTTNSVPAASISVPSTRQVSHPGDSAAAELHEHQIFVGAEQPAPVQHKHQAPFEYEPRWQQQTAAAADVRGIFSAFQHNSTRRNRAHSTSSGLHRRNNAADE